jgi:hypothetical protein
MMQVKGASHEIAFELFFGCTEETDVVLGATVVVVGLMSAMIQLIF